MFLPRRGWVLRACITSFRTTDEDLDVLLEELATASRATAGGEADESAANLP